jgi:hypothetical protein
MRISPLFCSYIARHFSVWLLSFFLGGLLAVRMAFIMQRRCLVRTARTTMSHWGLLPPRALPLPDWRAPSETATSRAFVSPLVPVTVLPASCLLIVLIPTGGPYVCFDQRRYP